MVHLFSDEVQSGCFGGFVHSAKFQLQPTSFKTKLKLKAKAKKFHLKLLRGRLPLPSFILN
jgi:hypothetical protein